MTTTKCGFNDGKDHKGCDLLVLMGPTLFVNIGFDKDYKPAPGVLPKPTVTGIQALVDTGATESCIDAALAAQFALPVIDRRKVSGISGVREVNMHLAQIHVVSLNFTIYGAFAGVDLTGGSGLPHRALIGRTFLRQFTMIYTGPTGDVELRRTS
ncbi:MAG: retroviral-like aspartic protease family protein [Terriglobia bacterium]